MSNPFNTKEPFAIEIKSGGIRRATLKYPTDGDWISRTATQKIIRTDLGREKATSQVTPLEEFDKHLFDRLVVSQEPEFDEFEASLAIGMLGSAEVITYEELADTIEIVLSVYGLDDPAAEKSERRRVKFVVRQPRRRQVVEYSRTAVKVTHVRKGAETRVSLEPSLRLFDALFVSSEGYAEGSDIPIMHKDAAIVELIQNQQSPEA